jgi:hypothetical protein
MRRGRNKKAMHAGGGMAWIAEMDFAPCGGIIRNQVQRVSRGVRDLSRPSQRPCDLRAEFDGVEGEVKVRGNGYWMLDG